MDYIPYEADKQNSTEARNALQTVEGITSVRGSATYDLYELQEKANTDHEEIDSCLNTVTCRIM